MVGARDEAAEVDQLAEAFYFLINVGTLAGEHALVHAAAAQSNRQQLVDAAVAVERAEIDVVTPGEVGDSFIMRADVFIKNFRVNQRPVFETDVFPDVDKIWPDAGGKNVTEILVSDFGDGVDDFDIQLLVVRLKEAEFFDAEQVANPPVKAADVDSGRKTRRLVDEFLAAASCSGVPARDLSGRNLGRWISSHAL